jgi:hyperosmotically inducible periplasmic protein
MESEKKGWNRYFSTLVITGLGGVLLLAGCSEGPKYPNSKPAVTSALAQDNLSNLVVSQDRQKGVITLTGTVPSQEKKFQAEDIVKNAAPKYTLADETTVVPPPSAVVPAQSDTDIAIQDQFNKDVKKHRYLADDDMTAKSTNGDVVLTGTVRTDFDKREAEKLAKAIPNVQKVENNLQVEPHRR